MTTKAERSNLLPALLAPPDPHHRNPSLQPKEHDADTRVQHLRLHIANRTVIEAIVPRLKWWAAAIPPGVEFQISSSIAKAQQVSWFGSG
jgi:hypothetical protein